MRILTRLRTARGERGQIAVEMVFLVPVMVAFILVVVAMGRYVSVRGDVEAASRDAARAASLERSSEDGEAAARETADASLNGKWSCTAAELGGDFASGGTVSIRLTCQVPWSGLGLIGLKGSKTVTATSYAPLDLYRRTG